MLTTLVSEIKEEGAQSRVKKLRQGKQICKGAGTGSFVGKRTILVLVLLMWDGIEKSRVFFFFFFWLVCLGCLLQEQGQHKA